MDSNFGIVVTAVGVTLGYTAYCICKKVHDKKRDEHILNGQSTQQLIRKNDTLDKWGDINVI